MTDAPEKIYAWPFNASKQDDIIKGGWNDEDDDAQEYIRADAIAKHVKVKPLVWDDLGEADAGCEIYYHLEQPRSYDRWCVYFGEIGEMQCIGTAGDRDAAIAIADAHHEARIREALE